MKNKSFIKHLTNRAAFLARLFSVLALISVIAHSGLAQREEKPRSFAINDLSQDRVARKILPKINIDRLAAEDGANRKKAIGSVPNRFAVAASAAFTLKNSGTWQNLPDGRLWRLQIQSPGAKNMNLGFTQFNMTPGAKLWIYDPERKNIEGPYTARDRSHQGRLWTPLIPGDTIVVELFVPKSMREPVIQIGSVNQGYRNLDDSNDLVFSCENDVVCPEGDPWRDQIRSVGAYSVNGLDMCSGQLVNNTAMDFKPYFLSAYHCGVNSSNDDTVVVYWNFQSPNCGDHGGGSRADNQTGAIFRASSSPSDFLLLELEEMPDPSFNVFYSGWDASGSAPASSVAIHHPDVDVKSISFNTNPVTSTANLSDTTDPAANHWRVDSFEDGAVEHGSSGSCLWDAATGRCVGQLHSGYPACPGGPYWYGKLSVDWVGGGTDATRLSNWLDPIGGGTTTSMDGDPHITTTSGIRYDFQGYGEFVSLRGDDLEIQTRMTGIGTDFVPGADPYHGLATCVSINTAVAARVGKRRVTIQPNISGKPDPSGLQVRIDGVLTTVPAGGINLGPGAMIDKAGNAFQINFPNGAVLVVTPLFWNSQNKWYLNVEVVQGAADGMGGGDPRGSRSSGGLMSAIGGGTWLPLMSDGTSVGPMPASLNQRFNILYLKFGESWRVDDQTSLFDYAPGTSTATFTDRNWPRQNSSCKLPDSPPVRPISAAAARKLCNGVTEKNAKEHCIFDAMNTGEAGFAKLYLAKQRVRNGMTAVDVNMFDIRGQATFTAVVTRRFNRGVPTGAVQFTIDGRAAGEPVKLDTRGRASWKAPVLRGGNYQIGANFIPAANSSYLSSSRGRTFLVAGK